MNQYGKICKMLLGLVAFPLFSKISIMLLENTYPVWSDVFFFIGCYLFLYLFIFSVIDSAVENTASFHQRYNQENIKKPFIRSFIKNALVVSSGYKLIFNLGFLLILFLYLKDNI